MEKRFLIACVLSLLVLMTYSSFAKKSQPVVNNEVIELSKTSGPVEIAKKTELKENDPIFDLSDSKSLQDNNLHTFETDSKIYKFSKKGGFLSQIYDKNLKTTFVFKGVGYTPKWGSYVFSVSELPQAVVFDYVMKNGEKIKKTFQVGETDTIELTICINDIKDFNTSHYDIFVGFINASETKDPLERRYFESCILQKEVTLRKPAYNVKKSIDFDGKITWAALRDRYFCVLMKPLNSSNKAILESFDNAACLKLLVPEHRSPTNNAQIEDQFLIFIGAQDIATLKNFGFNAEKLVNFGTFDIISRWILFLLSIIYNATKNWGVAIILATVLIYIVLSPLSVKSMISMKKMQSLQPSIEQLRQKNKDNPQKLNIEIMELYRREKVNPLGGCLPMILQIPVFFALYQLLMRLISLKGADFLWIKDLSEPDRLLVFKHHIPIFGNELNLLPFLMAGGMFLQQKLSSASTDAMSSEQQKILTFMMPVVFCVLFYKLSSGLVLYWFINSMLMLLFQWKILKKHI